MRVPQLLAHLGLSLVWAFGASACSGDSPMAPLQGEGVALQEVASGLSFPLYLTTPAGDAARLFVVEKTGGIRIVRDGVLLPEPFLDISAKISNGGEQGLLGLAFDPEYAVNGRFVVHYTDLAGNTTLSLFLVSSDPDRADPASEAIILTAAQPFPNHNGGQVAFGPDGFLYLGLGDGGGSGDPEGRGQDLSELLGSILRIDVRSGAPYSIPADNPFVGTTGARPEVWSYGLRNPWRFSFDRGTGDLYIGDVGQAEFEEIDVSPAAEGAGRSVNYGWNRMEGAHCFGGSGCDQTGLTLPVLEYDHSSGSCSVNGGYVYRGTAIPELQGQYFYSDVCQGWVRSFRYVGGAATEVTEWPALRTIGTVSFGEDAAGELYILDSGGRVLRVVPQP